MTAPQMLDFNEGGKHGSQNCLSGHLLCVCSMELGLVKPTATKQLAKEHSRVSHCCLNHLELHQQQLELHPPAIAGPFPPTTSNPT